MYTSNILSLFSCLFLFADDLVKDDPVFRQDDKYFLTGEEAYDRAMEKSVRYVQLCNQEGLSEDDKKLLVR